MTIQIGRFGSDVNVTPSSMQQSGRRLSVSGYIVPSTLADAKVLRQQLMGLVDNTDEPVVPLVCTDDSSFDGFYRVTGASCEMPTDYLLNNRIPFSCDLEALPGTSSVALVEFPNLVGERITSSALGASRHLGIPSTWTLADRTSTTLNRLGESITMKESGTNPSSVPYAYAPASAWYTGACTILESSKRVVGKRVAGTAITTLTMSNGLAEYTFASSTSSSLVTSARWHNGTSWSTAKDFTITGTASGGGTRLAMHPLRWVVLRNTPWASIVRVICGFNGTYGSLIAVDLTLRRGHRSLEMSYVKLSQSDSATFQFGNLGCERSSAEAASLATITAVDYGIVATSVDASSNKYIIGQSTNYTAGATELTNGRINTFNSGQGFIGVSIGSSPTTPETTQIQFEYFSTIPVGVYRVVG